MCVCVCVCVCVYFELSALRSGRYSFVQDTAPHQLCVAAAPTQPTTLLGLDNEQPVMDFVHGTTTTSHTDPATVLRHLRILSSASSCSSSMTSSSSSSSSSVCSSSASAFTCGSTRPSASVVAFHKAWAYAAPADSPRSAASLAASASSCALPLDPPVEWQPSLMRRIHVPIRNRAHGPAGHIVVDTIFIADDWAGNRGASDYAATTLSSTAADYARSGASRPTSFRGFDVELSEDSDDTDFLPSLHGGSDEETWEDSPPPLGAPRGGRHQGRLRLPSLGSARGVGRRSTPSDGPRPISHAEGSMTQLNGLTSTLFDPLPNTHLESFANVDFAGPHLTSPTQSRPPTASVGSDDDEDRDADAHDLGVTVMDRTDPNLRVHMHRLQTMHAAALEDRTGLPPLTAIQWAAIADSCVHLRHKLVTGIYPPHRTLPEQCPASCSPVLLQVCLVNQCLCREQGVV